MSRIKKQHQQHSPTIPDFQCLSDFPSRARHLPCNSQEFSSGRPKPTPFCHSDSVLTPATAASADANTHAIRRALEPVECPTRPAAHCTAAIRELSASNDTPINMFFILRSTIKACLFLSFFISNLNSSKASIQLLKFTPFNFAIIVKTPENRSTETAKKRTKESSLSSKASSQIFRSCRRSKNPINSRLTTLESSLQNTTTAATNSHAESIQKQLSLTHLDTTSRLNTLKSQLCTVPSICSKSREPLSKTPNEIITQIFSWIDSRHVFKYRRLSKRVDCILQTAHFAVLNQTNFDGMIREELKNCLKIDYTAVKTALMAFLGDGFSDGPGFFSNGLRSVNQCVERLMIYGVCGPTPKEISRLTLLKELEIHVSVLGVIPSEICGLVNLRYLVMTDCQLAGVWPEEFVLLVSLVYLNLGCNQLEGPLPANLGNFGKLTWLFLNGNRFSGQLPESIGNLLNLKGLKLSDNKLTGAVPNSLGNLTVLASLEMYNNNLSGSLPSSLKQLMQLRVCDFRDNPDLVCDFKMFGLRM
ncbi:hypothetical protein BDR26DRAFT_1001277 [Obelidium mucronatum]|nr:hypothetical protein BDR26DRAFT_1001277 [Obelidium mucronatum]